MEKDKTGTYTTILIKIELVEMWQLPWNAYYHLLSAFCLLQELKINYHLNKNQTMLDMLTENLFYNTGIRKTTFSKICKHCCSQDSTTKMKVKQKLASPHSLRHYMKIKGVWQLKKYCLKVFINSTQMHSFVKPRQDISTLKKRTLAVLSGTNQAKKHRT